MITMINNFNDITLKDLTKKEIIKTYSQLYPMFNNSYYITKELAKKGMREDFLILIDFLLENIKVFGNLNKYDKTLLLRYLIVYSLLEDIKPEQFKYLIKFKYENNNIATALGYLYSVFKIDFPPLVLIQEFMKRGGSEVFKLNI